MIRVRVKGYGELEARRGENLGRLLASHGLLPLPCGGRGFCGQCLVRVRGEVSPPTGNERARKLGPGLRLACQTLILGNVEVELLARPVLRVPLLSPHIEVEIRDPIFRFRKAELSPPFHRGLPPLDAGVEARRTPRFLVECCGSVRGLVEEEPAALLVDLGTTKIAYQVVDSGGRLLKEDAVLNPLSRYGADVVSRLTAALEDREDACRMRSLLLEAVKKAFPGGRTGLVAVAGNTVMESMFLGLPLETLAEKPFQPFSTGPFAGSLGSSALWAAPMIGGFVGGDASSDLAAALALGIEPPFMLIDLGTNTEILVYTGRDDDPLYAASTPAGPALEGHVEHGVGIHAPGVGRARISGVAEDGRPVFEVEVVGDDRPVGLLGSGVISVIAELARHGFLERGGRIAKGYVRIHGVKAFRITGSATGDVLLTQRDVREFQKAAAAVKAAWRIVLGEAGLRPDELRMVLVAGNLGSSVAAGDLLFLGLVPPVDEGLVASLGNMVLPGLKAMVLDGDLRSRVTRLAANARLVELAGRSDFMEKWLRGLSLY